MIASKEEIADKERMWAVQRIYIMHSMNDVGLGTEEPDEIYAPELALAEITCHEETAILEGI